MSQDKLAPIGKNQVWVNNLSGNEITVLKTLGAGKWWVEGRVGAFKVQEHLIRDNYTLKESAKNER